MSKSAESMYDYNSAVVGFDFSAESVAALRRGLLLSSGVDCALHIVTSLGTKTLPTLNTVDATYRDADRVREKIERIANSLIGPIPDAQRRVFVHTLIGDPVDVILEVADEVHADLIVVGTHGRRGVSRVLQGSVAELVVRRAHCPVLVVRETDYPAQVQDEPVPAPEPPCPNCLAAREASDGQNMWCETHASAEVTYETPLHRDFGGDEEDRRHAAWGGFY